ncbi:MAG: hypothetical protein L0219_13205 [Phycisphaerales bacterium]|nr:hypothetical protein [Phycisphaerales bacterium]MCI0675251.1 hypothetical protein [Phycisphaerales bacterium]
MPPLSVEQIARWARAHRSRTGAWPHRRSGLIAEARDLTWKKLNSALRAGSRDLPRGYTLAKVLVKHCGARTKRNIPPLTISMVLRWADDHHKRTGHWPTSHSGRVLADGQESWVAIDKALRDGVRHLPGGSSLSRLLAERRNAGRPSINKILIEHKGKLYLRREPKRRAARVQAPALKPISTVEVLRWVDSHYRRTGRWPGSNHGRIADEPLLTWHVIDHQLRPGGRIRAAGVNSLVDLLRTHRDVWNSRGKRLLSEDRISDWIVEHFERTGTWPTAQSGSVKESPGDTWLAITRALFYGSRGLKRGSSLSTLVRQCRIQLDDPALQTVTAAQILAWADEHRAKTGDWPKSTSGSVAQAPHLTWQAIHGRLRAGKINGEGSRTLVQLLQKHRGRPNQAQLPRLSIAQIVEWARRHLDRTGQWPHGGSGPVVDAPSENWKAIDSAFWNGTRGLPGQTSLSDVLVRHCGKRDNRNPPRLTVKQILAWADRHHAKHGSWPKTESGPIREAPGESWWTVNDALKQGKRGLPVRMRVLGLLCKHRGLRDPQNPPRLTIRQILQWADDHYERTGEWPSRQSGKVLPDAHERWSTIDSKLQRGGRGLRGGSTLVRVLSTHRRVQYRRRGLPLSVEQMIEWAQSHHELTGTLPRAESGPVRGVAGENWKAIDAALRSGSRNLRGKSSLERLLESRYQPPFAGCGQRLSVKKILGWAEDFRRRVGRWPTKHSAYVHPPPRRGERWSTIDLALREGLRGLPGGSSLQKLLRKPPHR